MRRSWTDEEGEEEEEYSPIQQKRNKFSSPNKSTNKSPNKSPNKGSFYNKFPFITPEKNSASNNSNSLNKTANISSFLSSSSESSSYHPPRTLDDYEILDVLGSGAQGRVSKARVKETGEIIALKEIYLPKGDSSINDNATREANALKQIKCHDFIACYFGNYDDVIHNVFLIEMEYIPGKTLDAWSTEYLLHRTEIDFYQKLVYIMYDLCIALEIIHKQGFIHRDIKPYNIVILSEPITKKIEENGVEIEKTIPKNTPQIVDFGLVCSAKVCDGDECCKDKIGTPAFMPPETIIKGESFFVSDIWSLGATIFYVANPNNRYVFRLDKNSNTNNLNDVINGLNQGILRLNTSNNTLNKAVNSCLTYNYKNRPTSTQLIKMLEPYIKQRKNI